MCRLSLILSQYVNLFYIMSHITFSCISSPRTVEHSEALIIISVKNCDADLKRQMRKYYANANMLLRKFSYCSPDVKCCMFKSYCFTMYCSSMWFDSTVTAMRKLKIAYNNVSGGY